MKDNAIAVAHAVTTETARAAIAVESEELEGITRISGELDAFNATVNISKAVTRFRYLQFLKNDQCQNCTCPWLGYPLSYFLFVQCFDLVL